MNHPWLYVLLLGAATFFVARILIDTFAGVIWGRPKLQGYLGSARTLNAEAIRPRAFLTIGLGIVSCFILTTSVAIVRLPTGAKWGPLVACGIFLTMDIAERINEAQRVWESGHLAAEAEYLRAARFTLITVLCFLPLAFGYAFAATVQKPNVPFVNLFAKLASGTGESVLWWGGVVVLARAIIILIAYLPRHFKR